MGRDGKTIGWTDVPKTEDMTGGGSLNQMDTVL